MSREWRSSVRSLVDRLSGLDDPRADAVVAAVSGRRWDLAALEAALATPDPEADGLRALLALPRPDGDEALAVLEALRVAVLEVEDTRHVADADERAEEIVRAALAWHAEHGDRPCPLCGTGQLGKGWRGWAELWLADRRGARERAAVARERVARAEEEARARLLRPFDLPAGARIATAALAAALAELAAAAPLEGRPLLRAIEEGLDAVATELTAVQAAAAARLAAREERWRPLALGIAGALARARSADPARETRSAPRAPRRYRGDPRREDLESDAR